MDTNKTIYAYFQENIVYYAHSNCKDKQMILIDNQDIREARLNLALEEYAVRNLDLDDSHLLFYINDPAIIIGKHQNTTEEINAAYVKQNNIHVVRRISGGGAVYHDNGNLNFSFITHFSNDNFNNYEKFTRPVIEALNQLGVNAELEGRNDIVVAGRKISGNAQYRWKDQMLSHGTLLFDTNLENVVQALNVSAEKIISKGIKSIRSRVANIKEFLPRDMNIEEFRQILLEHIFAAQKDIPQRPFNEHDWDAIQTLAREKYHSWDWNYGRSPAFNLQRRKRFAIGTIDIKLDVMRGLIKNTKIYGDFFAQNDIRELEKQLIGTRYDFDALKMGLRNFPLDAYFGGSLDRDEFVRFVCGLDESNASAE